MKKILILLIVAGNYYASAQTLLFHENFDPPSGPDSTFNLVYNGVQAFRDTNFISVSAPNCYFTKGVNSGSFSHRPYFQTPSFNTSGNFKYILLTFDNIAKTSNPCRVQISVDNGQTWSTLQVTSYMGNAYPPFGFFQASFYPEWKGNDPTAKPDNSWWKKETFNLTGIANNTSGASPVGYSNVKIKFLGPYSGYQAGWFVDNVKVTGTDCLPTPPILDTLYTPSFCYKPYHQGFTIAQASNSYPIGIEAKKANSDAKGIDSVSAYYQVKSGSSYSNQQHIKLQAQSANPDEYIGHINGVLTGDTIRYFIEAVDSCGNVSHLPNRVGGMTYRTFYISDTVMSKCGTAVCGAKVIRSFPWIEDFESQEWQQGSGFGQNINPPRGSFNDAPNQGWVINPLNTTGYGWSVGGINAGSPNSGPHLNNSSPGHKYIYTSFTQGPIPTSTSIATPCIDLTDSTGAVFRFAYHMYGQHIENLRMDIDTGSGASKWIIGVEEFLGAKQLSRYDPWQTKTINLASYRGKMIKIRFVSNRTTPGTLREVALDDFMIETVPATEAGIVGLVNESPHPCDTSTSIDLQIKVANNGYDTLWTVPFAYQLDSGVIIKDTIITGGISFEDTVNLNLQHSFNLNRSVAHNLKIWTELADDTLQSNDSLFTHIPSSTGGLIDSFPYIMDFENAKVTGGILQTGSPDWHLDRKGTSANWMLERHASNDYEDGPFFGNNFKGKFLMATQSTNLNDSVILSSGCIDLNGLVWPKLSFEYYLKYGVELSVYVRTQGEPWQLLIQPGHLPTGIGPLQREEAFLHSYTNKVIEIRFVGTHLDEEVPLALDNITITYDGAIDLSLLTVDRNITRHMAGSSKLRDIAFDFALNSGPGAFNPVLNVEFENICDTSAQVITGQANFSTGGNILISSHVIDSIMLSSPLPAGEYMLKLWSNLSGDSFAENDTLNMHAVVSGRFRVPYKNDFDSCKVLFRDNGGYDQWELITPSAGAHSGQKAYVTNETMGLNGTHHLFPPVFKDLDTLKGVELRFWHRYDLSHSTEYGQVECFIQGAWKPLHLYSTGGFNRQYSYSGTSGWKQSTFVVDNAVLPNGELFLRFKAKIHGSSVSGWAIDDFEITVPAQHSASPSNLTFSNQLPQTLGNQVALRIENSGHQDLTESIVVIKDQNGNQLLQEQLSFSPSLKQGNSRLVTLQTSLNIPVSTSELVIITSRPNNRTDAIPMDDTLRMPLKILQPVDNLPFCSDFETDQSLLGMDGNGSTLGNSWNHGKPQKNMIAGAYSGQNAWFISDSAYYPALSDEYLFTPLMEVHSQTCYNLNFWHWYETEDQFDGGQVEYSLDSGATWQLLGHFGDTAWYNRSYVQSFSGVHPGFSGSSGGWVKSFQEFKASYSGYIQFRFHFASNATISNDGWAIDNLCLEEVSGSCQSIRVDEIPTLGEGLEVYPNPASQNLQILLPVKGVGICGRAKLIIQNQQGKIIDQWHQEIERGTHYHTNISKLPAGVYFLKVVCDTKIFIKSFVKI